MKRFVFTAILFSLMLVSAQLVAAQTNQPLSDDAKKSVKTLKKSLAKNSRYGDEVVYWFNPVKFNACQVSYSYKRLNPDGNDRFATAVVDRTSPLRRTNTLRTQDAATTSASAPTTRTPNYYSSTQGNAYTATNHALTSNTRAKVFHNNSFPYYYYGINRRLFSLEQAVTIIDLSEIDANSVQVKTNSAGLEFIIFNSLKDKSAIEKQLIDAEKDLIEVESDFLPVTGKKSGAKISDAFIQAVRACQQ